MVAALLLTPALALLTPRVPPLRAAAVMPVGPAWSVSLLRLVQADAQRLQDRLECEDDCQVDHLMRWMTNRLPLVHWATGQLDMPRWQLHATGFAEALAEMLTLPLLGLAFRPAAPPAPSAVPSLSAAMRPLHPELRRAIACGMRASPVVVIVLALRLLVWQLARWFGARPTARRMLPRILDDAAIALEQQRRPRTSSQLTRATAQRRVH